MKIVHTSDWHLGARLHDRDRGAEHDAFLGWLRALLREERPDALLVSGDVFDLRQPGPAAQERYYRFLAGVAEDRSCRRVAVTAGNHDSASLLSASGRVLGLLGVTVVARATPDAAGEAVAVRDEAGRTLGAVAAIPFMGEQELWNLARAAGHAEGDRAARAEAGFRAHAAAAIAAARRLARGSPVAAMAHCTARGARASDERSERAGPVGGVEAVGADAFAGADYVALGHLHLPQGVGGAARYSGAPLAMSFAEAGQEKGVTIAELAPGEAPRVRQAVFPPPVPLRVFAGTPEAIEAALAGAVAEGPGRLYAALRVTAGTGDPMALWRRAEALCEDSGVALLLREDARPRAAASRLAEVPEGEALRMLTPLRVAALRLAEEPLSEDEREAFLGMLRGLEA